MREIEALMRKAATLLKATRTPKAPKALDVPKVFRAPCICGCGWAATLSIESGAIAWNDSAHGVSIMFDTRRRFDGYLDALRANGEPAAVIAPLARARDLAWPTAHA